MMCQAGDPEIFEKSPEGQDMQPNGVGMQPLPYHFVISKRIVARSRSTMFRLPRKSTSWFSDSRYFR